MSKRIVITTIFVLVACVALLQIFKTNTIPDRWDQQAQQLTIEAAQPLIEAIGQYDNDRQAYPNSLDALIPDYIDTLPTPSAGSQCWTYRVTKQGYELYVQSSNPEPPSMVSSLIFGMGDFDDRYFRYSDVRKVWEMADW